MTEESRVEMLERNLREIATDIALGRAGKIHAIKAWRAATGATLKDSKDYIEGISSRAEQSREDSRIQRVEDRLHFVESRLIRLEGVSPALASEGREPSS